MNKIMNIVNFIRAVEPRPGRKIDLVEPVHRQMELARQYRLPVTWLLQYDALLEPAFTDYLKENMDYRHEVGLWFEVVQPQAEKAGIPWRGRYPWDWHVDKGFSIGYTPAERERLADVFMEEFLQVWGKYPDAVGSWFIDAHLLNYLHERYGISASCNCKDQWGTDGYTLWGGYWANAYYPSRFNSYIPAQTVINQIPVPVFRMLGSDPIYQYSGQIGGNGQCVITLEPISAGHPDGGGGKPEWVRWFFATTYTTPCLSMSYAQTGQENSFGWPAMSAGITDQFALIAEWAAAGKLQVETLTTSARRFRKQFPLTPATAITALDDWQRQDRASIWYLSRFHRISFYVEDHELQIRDWQLFNELYREPFLDRVCTSPACTYDALPIMNSLHQQVPIRFRQRLNGQNLPLPGRIIDVSEKDDRSLTLIWKAANSRIDLVADEAELTVNFSGCDGAMEYPLVHNDSANTIVEMTDERTMNFRHHDFAYSLRCQRGSLRRNAATLLILPDEEGTITLSVK